MIMTNEKTEDSSDDMILNIVSCLSVYVVFFYQFIVFQLLEVLPTVR